MKAISIGLAVMAMVAARSAPAWADDGAAEGKLVVGGGLTVWIPTGDADDVADTSLGVRPVATYWILPFVGLTASFDFVFVNEDAGVGDTTYFAISAGGRVTMPGRRRIKPYGELLLGFHRLDSDGFDDNALGFRLGGGATYALGALIAHAGIGYSTASFDAGFFDVSIDAFVLDLGLSARF